ncbi:MAG: peroxide stress protein YaaA [Pontiellaceae bacterium]|nr:peroxide stress protein YaaA [Pontiellaceae bacterium]MBN2785381.1 peroxide stress protein YaaA [Pontiellaceae bacterium]
MNPNAPTPSGASVTNPAFLDKSEMLAKAVRRFSTQQLAEFMEISEKLAELNRKRFTDWQHPFTPENSAPALTMFSGDVYEGLDAESLSNKDVDFAQDHLRILSGLYGLLRPLDRIQPYRLEMGRALKTEKAKNLYQFWKRSITEALEAEPGGLVVNLASQEYFKVVDRKALSKEVISPVFKDEKNGRFKIISFYAKKARGTMARYLLKNRICDKDELIAFAEDGYAYKPELSTPDAPVFTRPESR